ncbi:hypothetical protein [Neisseria basseii]|uniref:hypothetical protein n=1 Tax=Neisseria basseii TaxID=2830650 RepID=UPI00265A08A9|nr:hypothetical protein [Neisseria basseii]
MPSEIRVGTACGLNMESVGLYSISPAFILQQTDVVFQTAYLLPDVCIFTQTLGKPV